MITYLSEANIREQSCQHDRKKVLMYIPDMTERFPEGMYSCEEPEHICEDTFREAIDFMKKTTKENDWCPYLIYVSYNGKRERFDSFDELYIKFRNILDNRISHYHWYDEEILFIL